MHDANHQRQRACEQDTRPDAGLLQPGDFDGWLAGNAGIELLRPAGENYLQTWPVSRRVNSSRAPGDDPTLIEQAA